MSEPFVSTAKTGNYRLDDADFLANAELLADTGEVGSRILFPMASRRGKGKAMKPDRLD
jgi:hypothetical protein